MLTSCPKCGFNQPEDQYCARCGIDMVAYKPPEKSALQKLSESLFIQLSLVMLVGILAVYFITQNHQQSFWSRMKFLRGSSTQVSRSDNANQFSSAQAPAPPAVVQSQSTKNPQAPIADAKVLKKAETKIYYLEIPESVLSKWLEDGVLTRVETSEDITIGYIPKLQQALDQYASQIKVLKQDSYAYNLNQLYTAKMEFSSTTTPEPTSAGRTLATATENNSLPQANTPPPVITYATLEDDRNDTVAGQLEVSVNPQTSFPAHFEMAPDQSFFISGFIKKPMNRSSTNGRIPANETVVVFKIDK